MEVPTSLPRTTILDPVHGHIPLTNEEYGILQIPSFLRLHRVRVMGLAYLVFPNALTSRFIHCVGTMHVAGKMITSILQKMDKKTYKNIFEEEKIEYVIRAVRLAALLHDLNSDRCATYII